MKKSEAIRGGWFAAACRAFGEPFALPAWGTHSARAFGVRPVGIVRSSRPNPEDDRWDAETARIVLDSRFPEEALDGIEEFSHVEVLYRFHKAKKEQTGACHPRENPAWPRVGIFAQRKKDRPNRIGATVARVTGREGRTLFLAGLDAIDGTPVIDIKPVFAEYLPRGDVRQPEWTRELMKDYW
jgi:tRNA-Thr(GGU) m(6)t(6)A37 methyltransferase TsaA